MRAVLLVFLFACGGKAKDDGELKIPILDEKRGSGSTSTAGPTEPEPTEPVAPERPEITEPTTPYTNTDLASDARPKGGQAEIAWTKNQEGITAMNAGKYPAASSAFRDAVARVPDPKYFLNLCMSLFQEGKFAEALVSCDAVLKNAPAPAIQIKTDRMIGRIRYEARKQGVEVESR